MLHEALHNRLVLRGELLCQTAVRVGAGESNEPVGTGLPVIKDAFGYPFVPGSSLKGVLRSRVESFVRAINPGRKAACIPVGNKDGWCVREISEHMDDEQIYKETCLVCRAFGSPWFASKIQIRDALLVDPNLWFGQYQVRNGVAIDRDTQTVSAKKLYDYEVVPAQTRFEFSLIAENLTDSQIGMLFVGLRPFERREISIGGGRSRGLGVVELRLPERKLFTVNDDLERLFRFLDGDQGTEVWTSLTDKEIREMYLRAFRDELESLFREGGEPHAQAAPERSGR